MDLLEIIADFEGRHGRIRKSKREDYTNFIKAQLKIGFESKREAVDALLLYRYASGDKAIVDKDGKKRRMQKEKPEDFTTTQWISAKDNNGKKLNQKLYRLFVRCGNKNGYKEARDRVMDYLGIVIKEPEERGFEELVKYVLGRKSIFDKESGKKRRIRKGKLEDLVLLRYANIFAKDDKGQRYNSELPRLAGRFDRRHHKNKNYLTYPRALEVIFKKTEVVDYFGAKPSYKEHVIIKKLKTYERTDRPMEEYIPKKLIPLWLSYRGSNDLSAKEKLFEHYYEKVCKPTCAKILKDFPQANEYYNSPEELLQFTYDKLDKKLENYDIESGIKFETYLYRAIRGRVIDELRKQKIMIRKGSKKKKKIIQLDEPRSRDGKIKQSDLLGIDDIYEANIPEKDTDRGKDIKLDYLLKGLTDQQKTIFVEHGLNSKPYSKIRQFLKGVSIPRCSQIYSKAIKKVRKNYEDSLKA